MSNIEEKFLHAVEIMVDRAIQQAKFDQTIKGTIVSCENKQMGKYKVKYLTGYIYAYANSIDVDYPKGTEVYILVPQGDFSGDKTILGTTKRLGESNPFSNIILEDNKYEIIGENLLGEDYQKDNLVFPFCSYDTKNLNNEQTEYENRIIEHILYTSIPIANKNYSFFNSEKILYTDSNGKDIGDIVINGAPLIPDSKRLFKVDELRTYLEMGGKYLHIKAKFNITLPEEQRERGNFGIQLKLKYLLKTPYYHVKEENVDQKFSLLDFENWFNKYSSSDTYPFLKGVTLEQAKMKYKVSYRKDIINAEVKDMKGTPYFQSLTQNFYFDISTEDTFIEIESLSLFAKDFPSLPINISKEIIDATIESYKSNGEEIFNSKDSLIDSLSSQIIINKFQAEYLINNKERLINLIGDELNRPIIENSLITTGKWSADIKISNLEIYVANRIPEEGLNGLYLKLSAPLGQRFFADSTMDKKIQASLLENGKEINLNSENLSYYWFRQQTDITSLSDKYCSYGGEGWLCLNEKKNNLWKSASAEYIVKKAAVLSRKQKYKCVVVYGGIKFEKEITFVNDDVNWEITLSTSPAGTTFYRDQGIITLACAVFDNKKPLTSKYLCKYVWRRQNHLGQTSLINPDGSIVENNPAIEDDEAKKVSSFLEIPISSVVVKDIFICSVYVKYLEIQDSTNLPIVDSLNEFTYIGSAEIPISKIDQDLDKPLYSLHIKNGQQYFKYNEKGLSPTIKEFNDYPQKILPITLSILNNNTGVLTPLDELGYDATRTKIWGPTKDSLLLIKNEVASTQIVTQEDGKEGKYFKYSPNGIVFDIKEQYNSFYKNNNLLFTIVYNGVTLSGSTNFVFIKEGEDGSNGTDYFCRIVPNIDENNAEQIANIPEWISWENTDANNLSLNREFNFKPKDNAFPFKVKLSYFNPTEGPIDVEAFSKVTWSSLFRQYSSAISEYSLLQIGTNSLGHSGLKLIDVEESITDDLKVVPTSILKTEVKYLDLDSNELVFYAHLPIVDIQKSELGLDYSFEIKGGFSSVMYNAGGESPKYDSNELFYINVLKDGQNVNNSVVFDWSTLGWIYEKKGEDNIAQWWKDNLLKIDNKTDIPNNACRAIPSNNYDGLSLSTGLKCVIKTNTQSILATIFIPIYFYLNRFGFAPINGWDGNSIDLGENSGMILAPQVGAGEKNTNNQFTGVVMGSVRDAENSYKRTGLVGFSEGKESFFLNAKTGAASFGLSDSGQIIFEPKNEKAILKSGNYEAKTSSKPGSGMQIDLTTPEIKFGNGNFSVNADGKLTAIHAKLTGSFELDSKEGEDGKFKVNIGSSEIYADEDFMYLQYDDNSEYMKIDLKNGSFVAEKPVSLEYDGNKIDTIFKTHIAPGVFDFGTEENIVVDEKIVRGGRIHWESSLGQLVIDGTIKADTGNIGGWLVLPHELAANNATKTIRLYSGKESEKTDEKGIPAFISLKGDRSEICSTDGKKVSLRKGGLYFYTSSSVTPDDEEWDNEKNQWQGRIYTNKNYNNALCFSSQGEQPMYFWGSNIPVQNETDSAESTGEEKVDEIDRIVMTIQPKAENGESFVRVGYSKKEESEIKLTTLYPNEIKTKNIYLHGTDKEKLKTKKKDVIGAINEIFPGGPLTLQHAISISEKEKETILYDYEFLKVLDKEGAQLGYNPLRSVIYAQGRRIGNENNYPPIRTFQNSSNYGGTFGKDGLYKKDQFENSNPLTGKIIEGAIPSYAVYDFDALKTAYPLLSPSMFLGPMYIKISNRDGSSYGDTDLHFTYKKISRIQYLTQVTETDSRQSRVNVLCDDNGLPLYYYHGGYTGVQVIGQGVNLLNSSPLNPTLVFMPFYSWSGIYSPGHSPKELFLSEDGVYDAPTQEECPHGFIKGKIVFLKFYETEDAINETTELYDIQGNLFIGTYHGLELSIGGHPGYNHLPDVDGAYYFKDSNTSFYITSSTDIIIPFASQVEYEAAINLAAIDSELRQVIQNETIV